MQLSKKNFRSPFFQKGLNFRYFKELHILDYARCGQMATSTVKLSEGPLPQFPFSVESQLRKLGLPTKLDKGT